jgi:MFS transporter, putative metabolite:H+ symporter
MPAEATWTRQVVLAVILAALGNFVDIYDLLLFSVLRVPSLKGLGVPPDQLVSKGILLLNIQNAGLLIGGVLWGILGDRRGRLYCLAGSIAVYSIANIANGFVQSVESYAVTRLIAGIGLAGELGAGITLVAEIMPKASRGYGTMIVACAGMLGGVTGSVVGDVFSWRTAYFVGGGMGICLLALRIGVRESALFEKTKRSKLSRGRILALFSSVKKTLKYLRVVVVAVPIWLPSILLGFAPEILKDLGMVPVPNVARGYVFYFLGMFLGDLGTGLVSQILKSRKWALGLWLAMDAIAIIAYFLVARSSLTAFYAVAFVLGFSSGYQVIYVTAAAESYGTNIRATVTTTVPNLVRGSVLILTYGFISLRPYLGIGRAAAAIAIATMLIVGLAFARFEETFHKDLDYVEE